MGGAGVFNFPLQEHYKLEDINWKYDVLPEIVDGKNVWDFYDKGIPNKLEELEKEEEMLLLGKDMEEEDISLDPSLYKAYEEVKSKRAIAKLNHKLNKKNRVSRKNVDLVDVEKGLAKIGRPSESLRVKFNGKRKGRALDGLYKETVDEMEIEDGGEGRHEQLERKADRKMRAMSRSRSKGAKKELSENDSNMLRLKRKIQKEWKHSGISGESDRRVDVKLPKHLYSGQMGIGKRDRR